MLVFDPNFAWDNHVEGVVDQTLHDHLIDNAGTYDAVCAFQVIEHLASPAKLFADMLRAARPGRTIDSWRSACSVSADANSQFPSQCAAKSFDVVDAQRAGGNCGASGRRRREHRACAMGRERCADLLDGALLADPLP